MPDVSDLVDPTGKPLKGTNAPQDVTQHHGDYKEQYVRALADYKNLQRQIQEERKLIFTLATANVLEQLLPTLDMLYKAEIFVKDPGMQMVKDQLLRVLEEFGLKEIDLAGKEYDPHTAEVVGTVEAEQDNVVVEVVRRGYALEDKVIRVGQVKVGKKHETAIEH